MTGYQMAGAAMILLPVVAVLGVMVVDIARTDGVGTAALIVGSALFAFAWIMLGAFLAAGG